MAYQLGIKPDSLKVLLHRDADFDSVLTRTADDEVTPLDWGSRVRLVFPLDGTEWEATVTGNLARFQIDRLIVNARSNRELVELWVDEQCWATGKVTRTGTKGVTATVPIPTPIGTVVPDPDPDPDPGPGPGPVSPLDFSYSFTNPGHYVAGLGAVYGTPTIGTGSHNIGSIPLADFGQPSLSFVGVYPGSNIRGRMKVHVPIRAGLTSGTVNVQLTACKSTGSGQWSPFTVSSVAAIVHTFTAEELAQGFCEVDEPMSLVVAPDLIICSIQYFENGSGVMAPAASTVDIYNVVITTDTPDPDPEPEPQPEEDEDMIDGRNFQTYVKLWEGTQPESGFTLSPGLTVFSRDASINGVADDGGTNNLLGSTVVNTPKSNALGAEMVDAAAITTLKAGLFKLTVRNLSFSRSGFDRPDAATDVRFQIKYATTSGSNPALRIIGFSEDLVVTYDPAASDNTQSMSTANPPNAVLHLPVDARIIVTAQILSDGETVDIQDVRMDLDVQCLVRERESGTGQPL